LQAPTLRVLRTVSFFFASAVFVAACSSHPASVVPNVNSQQASISSVDRTGPVTSSTAFTIRGGTAQANRMLATPPPAVPRTTALKSGLRPASTVTQGSDTSNDECSSWCVISGQTLTIPGFTSGESRPGTMTWATTAVPTGLSINFNPAVTSSSPYTSNLVITADTSLRPGIYPYSYYLSFAPSDGTQGYTTGTANTSIIVVCSNIISNVRRCRSSTSQTIMRS